MVDEKRAGVRAEDFAERKDRVLIVEDEENARKGYEQLLQRWGYEVLSVGNAEDALAKFGSYQPDTLIADVELPGMNGLDLLSQLGPELADVPAIIITGKGSEERAVAAIEAGAFWYIEKPLKGPVLRALLDRALGKARDARQLVVLQRQLRETGRLGDLVGAWALALALDGAPGARTLEPKLRQALEREAARRPASALAVAAGLPGGNPVAEALAAGAFLFGPSAAKRPPTRPSARGCARRRS